MTRTPEVAASHLVDDTNEFATVGDSSKLTRMIAKIDDIQDLWTEVLQMADKYRPLIPPSTSADQDTDADKRPALTEQATQTVTDDGELCISYEKHAAEIDKLKKMLKEVVDKNVGWQLVHEQQEKIIAELKLLLQQQQHQTSLPLTASPPPRHPGSVAEQPDQLTSPECDDDRNGDDLETLRRRCLQLEHDKNELEDTVRCLTSQLESMQELMRQLESTVDQQHNKLDSVIQEKQTFIDMLQAQILVYREDFQCERQDRERAQGKIVELKTEMEHLKNRLAEQVTRQSVRGSTVTFSRQPVVSIATQHNDFNHYSARVPPTAAAAYPYYPVADPTPREAWFYSPVGRDEVDCTTDGDDSNRQNVCTDGVMTSDGSESEVDRPHVSENEASDVLRCPCCRKSYTMDQHVDLMDHMDACLAG